MSAVSGSLFACLAGGLSAVVVLYPPPLLAAASILAVVVVLTVSAAALVDTAHVRAADTATMRAGQVAPTVRDRFQQGIGTTDHDAVTTRTPAAGSPAATDRPPHRPTPAAEPSAPPQRPAAAPPAPPTPPAGAHPAAPPEPAPVGGVEAADRNLRRRIVQQAGPETVPGVDPPTRPDPLGPARLVQCGHCAGFDVDIAGRDPFGFTCLDCGTRWSWQPGERWPDLTMGNRPLRDEPAHDGRPRDEPLGDERAAVEPRGDGHHGDGHHHDERYGDPYFNDEHFRDVNQ